MQIGCIQHTFKLYGSQFSDILFCMNLILSNIVAAKPNTDVNMCECYLLLSSMVIAPVYSSTQAANYDMVVLPVSLILFLVN